MDDEGELDGPGEITPVKGGDGQRAAAPAAPARDPSAFPIGSIPLPPMRDELASSEETEPSATQTAEADEAAQADDGARGEAAPRARRKSLQEVESVLERADIDEDAREDWLEFLRSLGGRVSDAELTLILDGSSDASVAPATRIVLGRRLNILRHDARRLWVHRPFLHRAAYAGLWLNLLVGAVLKGGLTVVTVLSALGIVTMKGWAAIKELDPKHMRLLKYHYDERKLMLQKLLHTQQRWFASAPTAREVETFFDEALALISLYVRDHRGDLKDSKKIFANLLVRDGDEVVVVRRSGSDRPFPLRYGRESCGLAWEALRSGAAQVTGDVFVDFPNTPKTKKYRSVLVLPVKLQGAVLGAVSIDSELPYHFDSDFHNLQAHLAPYVQLLALALSYAHATTLASRALPAGG
jgi:hypothetical protein